MITETTEYAKNLSSIYGSSAFNDAAMRERLPKGTYQLLRRTVELGIGLDPSVAEVVANAMKDWAIEKGATHFTHWFQPMTGATAEKHDSFISPTDDGRVIMEFSGKELVRGESDASSFPSGGLRATFEARGYTAWDCTSPAFVKDNTLYIPTAFCSFTGEALDQKTPLLRSMEALSKQAIRVLRLLGDERAQRVVSYVGPEQEYFLVDRALFNRRKDLRFCGRTLFGAKAPKGQEMDDHYYGNIKERVKRYMREVDEELWKLGVSAKTEHNEAAPAQHELASIYTTANIACDHNQLIMETIKKVALRHDLVCILHEKPFQGVNGSGKHNNWSPNVLGGGNLLDFGKTTQEHARFLLFMCAVIWAVDEYADLLRVTVAGAGNDHRLGANEAPPSIVSIFLGEPLYEILLEAESGGPLSGRGSGKLEIGVPTMPPLPADASDRNRTSPFAFDGKKFEFRMPGASQAIADCNTVLNTIVAETLSRIADRLERAEERTEEISLIVRDVIRAHKRVIFNGNSYSQEWVEEAARRGLPNLKSTVDAIPALADEKNIAVMQRHNVLSRTELNARCEIGFENYVKTMRIEYLTMLDMARREIVPAAVKYLGALSETIVNMRSTQLPLASASIEKAARTLAEDIETANEAVEKLQHCAEAAEAIGSMRERARYINDKILPAMEALRTAGDRLECEVAADYWPIPTYAELLFNV